jgi:hypothetical protein
MTATLQAPIHENIQLTGINWQTYQAVQDFEAILIREMI